MINPIMKEYDFNLPLKIIYIYALKNPVTYEIFYVGSSNDPWQRLRHHFTGLGINRQMCQYISVLKEKQLKPILLVIEEVMPILRDERERFWIEYYAQDFTLLNIQHNECKDEAH